MNFDLLSWLSGLGSGIVSYILPFVVVLTIVVFFHELGHFLVARRCGVKILTFSIGFGPELLGFNDRHGTRWKISAIPLGGYVKFFGDDNVASTPDQDALARMSEAEKAHSFMFQGVGRRAAIVVAGPLANFILAVVIFASVFSLFGRQVTSARVDMVTPGSAAEAAGIKPGDLVVAIDGRPIESFAQMQRIVSTNAGRTLTLTVDRGGVREELKAVPTLHGFCNGVLGIRKSFAPDDVKLQRVAPLNAVGMGLGETYFIVERSLCYMGGVILGRESADQLGGPARIAQVSGQAWKAGFDSGGPEGAVVALFYLAGLLSASIGFLNLFPVPLLDGGHLLFYGIEWIRGKPLSDRAQEIGFRIGLAIVVMLMIFATYNDIVQIAAQWKAS